MKKKIINIFVFFIVLGGIIILTFPFVSFQLNKRNQTYVVQDYDDTIARMTAEELEKEWNRAVSYNDSLVMNTLHDAFTSKEADLDEEYMSLLNINGDGVMSYIEIPKIDVELPVYHGTSTEVLEIGAGHMSGTALPVGGSGTHAILTGHTGLGRVKLFTDLIELKEGDEFYVRTLGRILAYRVDNIKVVLPTDVADLQPVEGKDLMTLVTCTPYGVNSHRLLIQGERTEYTNEEAEQKMADTESITSQETYMLYVGLALLFLFGIVILFRKIRRASYKKRLANQSSSDSLIHTGKEGDPK